MLMWRKVSACAKGHGASKRQGLEAEDLYHPSSALSIKGGLFLPLLSSDEGCVPLFRKKREKRFFDNGAVLITDSGLKSWEVRHL